MMLVVGAGAVGTILTAYLANAGREPLQLYTRTKDLATLQGRVEIRVEQAGTGRPPILAARPALTQSLDLNGIDYLLICVKFPQLESLLDQLGDIPAGTTIVSTLNGISALRRIRARYPNTRVVPMSVMFNGQLLAPLHAQLTTRPSALIGSDDSRLLAAFRGGGMQVTQVAGESAAWGKLLINLANAICALTHTTFKDLFTRRELRVTYAAVAGEAVELLERAGIAYKLPMPIPFSLYKKLLTGNTPLLWWIARIKNGLNEGAYPSMVSDIANGRLTEVDQLNGEIVHLGQERNIPTPLNRKIVELVHAMEASGKAAEYLTPEALLKALQNP